MIGEDVNYQILEPPFAGWSKFTFHDDARISYVNDFPTRLIKEAIDSILLKNHDFCVTMDVEGYNYTLLSYDLRNLEIVIRKEVPVCFVVKHDDKVLLFGDFLRMVISDIEAYMDEWAEFTLSFVEHNQETMKKIKQKKKELSNNLYKLKRLLTVDKRFTE